MSHQGPSPRGPIAGPLDNWKFKVRNFGYLDPENYRQDILLTEARGKKNPDGPVTWHSYLPVSCTPGDPSQSWAREILVQLQRLPQKGRRSSGGACELTPMERERILQGPGSARQALRKSPGRQTASEYGAQIDVYALLGRQRYADSRARGEHEHPPDLGGEDQDEL